MSMRVYSAVQSSGRMHIGNYLGALQHWVQLEQQSSCTVYAIADLHALTSRFDGYISI